MDIPKKFTYKSYLKLSLVERDKLLNFIQMKYCDELLTDTEISQLINSGSQMIQRIRLENNIRRTPEQQKLLNEKHCLEKYGVKSTNQLKSKKEKAKQTCLEKYGVENPFQDTNRMKQAYQKKLGVDNPWQSESVKEKIKQTKLDRYDDENYNNIEKIKQTNLGKYGVEYNLQSEAIKEKIKQTTLERYGVECVFQDTNKMKRAFQKNLGVDNPFQSETVKEKIKQTNLEKYGTRYSFQSEDVKEKIKKTCLEKYGTEIYTQSDDYKQKQCEYHKQRKLNGLKATSQKHLSDETLKIISNKDNFRQFILSLNEENRNIKDIANSLGLTYSPVGKYIKLYNCEDMVSYKTGKSYIETDVATFIKSLDVQCKTSDRYLIHPYELDIYVQDYNFAIEFNGSWWHSNLYKSENYHQEKSLKAQEKGIFVYHIFEYEWNNERMRPIIESQLRNLCYKNENKIYARQCEIRELTDIKQIREFLNTNHLQGFRNSKIKLGLFYNNELVTLMTFGKPYLNKSTKYDYELYRFCNKLNTSVIGGFDKLFKYFIKTYSPESILTYSDFAKGDGHTYEKMGFKKLELTKPNYVWFNVDTKNILTRYQTQMKNEKEIMEDNNYIKIYDCGNKKWLYNIL